MRPVVAMLVMVTLAGCTSPAIDSGLEGVITVGPTCPVERDPPDPDCADKPLAVTLQALQGSIVVATFDSDEDGHYKVALPEGTYTIRDKAQSLPRCDAGPVTVIDGVYTRLDFACDSGIR